MSALSRFGWTGTNCLKISHASMKLQKKFWLSYASYVDVCHMIMQQNEYISFMQNKVKTVGLGPSTVHMPHKETEAGDDFIRQVLHALRVWQY